MRVSLGNGRFTTGKLDAVFSPIVPRPGPVCVYLHSGSGFGEVYPTTTSFPGVQGHIRAIVERLGWTVVAPQQPMTLGNGAAADTGGTTCQGVLTDAIAYHRANLGGSAAPVVLLGTSMGSLTALRRAGLAPTTVAAVVGFLTVADLTIAYVDNLGSNRALIASSYGGFTPSAPPVAGDLPANSCPTHQLSDSVPKLLTHASDDLYSTSTGHVLETELATGRGATFLTTGAQGHTDASVLAVPVATVTNFLGAHS